jgi:hypothetical protein
MPGEATVMARGAKLWKRDRDRHIAKDAEREIRAVLREKAAEVALRIYRLQAA